jgi:hypothetical protein
VARDKIDVINRENLFFVQFHIFSDWNEIEYRKASGLVLSVIYINTANITRYLEK